jgi:hypothetical protein
MDTRHEVFRLSPASARSAAVVAAALANPACDCSLIHSSLWIY